MYVAITHWLSRNHFRSEKMELDLLTGGVTQSLKVADGVAGYGFLYLTLISLETGGFDCSGENITVAPQQSARLL
jgi:hypothetical protein